MTATGPAGPSGYYGRMPTPKIPEGMNKETAEIWKTLYKAAKDQSSGFGEAAAEVIARDPELREKFKAAQRQHAVKKVAETLARANSILELPAESLEKIFRIPQNENLSHPAGWRSTGQGWFLGQGNY
jgi:hypothetical protein